MRIVNILIISILWGIFMGLLLPYPYSLLFSFIGGGLIGFSFPLKKDEAPRE